MDRSVQGKTGIRTSSRSFHLSAQGVSGHLHARVDFDRRLWCPFTFSKLVKAFNFSCDHEFSYNNELKSHSPLLCVRLTRTRALTKGQVATHHSLSSLALLRDRTVRARAAPPCSAGRHCGQLPLSAGPLEKNRIVDGTPCGHMHQRRAFQRSHMWIGAALQGLITVFPCEASASCDLYQLFD